MSEFVIVKRELLENLQLFLSDAFDGGLEGLLQEECGNHIDELRAVLAQEAGLAEEPVGMVEPVAVVRRVKTDVSERYEGVILASAILSGAVEEGAKLYASPPTSSPIYQFSVNASSQSWTDVSKEVFDEYASRGGWSTRIIYTSPPAPVSVPDGWKLVPIEPTEHMMKVARGLTLQQEQTPSAEYRAMVKAAPACIDKVKELNQ